MSSAGIINFIYNETIVSRALPSSSVDYKWFTGKNVWKVRFTRDIYGTMWTRENYDLLFILVSFFGCRWRYWGFICPAIFKIRLSESSIFLLRIFLMSFCMIISIIYPSQYSIVVIRHEIFSSTFITCDNISILLFLIFFLFYYLWYYLLICILWYSIY